MTDVQHAWRSWTTRQWLWVGVATGLCVLLALGAVVAWMIVASGAATDRLTDRSTPALIAAVRLESGMVNQETGVRGYALTGDPKLLTPYREGRTQEQEAAARLRELVGDDRRAGADLDLVLARAAAWQRDVATPIVAIAPTGDPVQASILRTDAGAAAFDELRAAIRAQQAHLAADQAQGRADLARAETTRDAVFAAIGVVVLALVALVVLGLRKGVTIPLERLSADVGRVAAGHFEHPIVATGPADLRGLAGEVESMRRRLADELAFREESRAMLDAQARDLRRSNQELEQFAYVASHDLQEPLRKVASFCQLLQRRYAGQLDDRADQYIEFAVDGASRMQTLIADLLKFSRVGRLNVANEQVDLDGVLADALEMLSVSVQEAGAEITHDPLPTVTGDPTQLGMLFQNLVGNAIKFRAPERPLRVHVSAERDGELWRFAVTDNGVGIEADFADKIFVIFQRLHARDAYPGNGIGLALCKKVVEFHGGVIDVDTTNTPGARILFTLPAAGPPVRASERAAATA